MKKTRISESQIIKALKEYESGTSTEIICREYGISRSTLYLWKKKYSGVDVSQLKRLKELEEENRRLKHMYAELSIDNKILKEVIEKKALKPEAKRAIVEEIVSESDVSIIRACRLLDVHRSKYYYKKKRDDNEVIEAIREKAEHSKDGFWKIYCRLRNDGYPWNHKRVYRVYKLMNLNYRRKLKRRLPNREKETLLTPNGKNISWSMDFVSDVLTNGRRFRVLNIIDDFNREAVAMEIGTSMPAERVIRIMEKVTWCYGKPESIRVDNGPEFIADTFKSWCNGNGIKIKYIQPGKPTQNSFIERFNGSYRKSILDSYLFDNLNQVRELTEQWMIDYNEHRPHESLGDISPKAYLEKMRLNETIKEAI